MESLSRGITVILVGVLLFILPLQYINDSYEFNAHNHTSEKTSEFTDTIRQQGYLTSEMYNNYVNELNATGELYNIEIEVASSVVGNEKSTSLNNKIRKINNNENMKEKAVLLGGNEYINTSMKNDLGFVKDKKESVSSHVHTSTCYGGTHYIENTTNKCTGVLNYTGGGSASLVRTSLSSYYTPNAYYMNYKCSECGAIIVHISMSRDSNEWEFKYQWTMQIYSDPNSINNFTQTMNGIIDEIKQDNMVENTYDPNGGYDGSHYYDLSVAASFIEARWLAIGGGFSYVLIPVSQSPYREHSVVGYYRPTGNQSNDIGNMVYLDRTIVLGRTTWRQTPHIKMQSASPMCNEIVASIVPTNQVQVKYNGESLNTTATVTYLDGSTKVVVCNTNFDTNNLGTNVNVELSYTGRDTATTTKTFTCNITVTILAKSKTCVNGHTYNLKEDGTDPGCQTCKEILVSISATPRIIKISKSENIKTKITLIGTYLDGHTAQINDWTSDFNPGLSGIQFVEIVYKNFKTLISVEVIDKIICGVCGSEYDAQEDGTDPGCPVCREEIVSITATPQSITVPVGTDMNIKVIATFRDGHTAEVDNWSSNFDTYREGKQTVTIFYNKFTTTVSVTVIGDTTTCAVCGNEYSWKEYPYGCPICSVTVESIDAYHKSESSTVTYGSNLSIYVILNYLDGHKEIATSGWTVEGYNPTRLGEQIVRVHYGIHSTDLEVTVINNLEKVTCTNGHVYYLNDDGTDPGCPYCVYTDLDTGLEYITIMFTEDIIKELELNNKVTFNQEDYITVRVKVRNINENKKTFIKTLYNFDNTEKEVIYGGRIL